MPDSRPPAGFPIVALALLAGAIGLGVLAGLIYAGGVPVREESRGFAALVVGAAAAVDFLVGLWVFRQGQAGARLTRSGREGVESS